MREPGEDTSGDLERWVEGLAWHEALTETDQARLTGTLIRDWQTWHADPENQRIFDQLSTLAADARQIPARRWKVATGEGEYDIAVPVARWGLVEGRSDRWSWADRWRARRTIAVVVTGVFVIAALMVWPWRGRVEVSQRGSVRVETPIGVLKQVHLADGSEITVGGSTKLTVELSAHVRSVELVRGEAWFRVAHDAEWPFVVHAGDGAIKAVGTAFLVTRDSDRVVVTVTEGTVAVSSSPLVKLPPNFRRAESLTRLPPPIRVRQGQEMTYKDNGTAASPVNADTYAATAWTQGRLIFDDEPLRYVIENVNRYFPGHVSATVSAGRLRFTGVILDSGIADWLQGLPSILPVQIDAGEGGGICIHMSAARSNPSCD